MDHFSFQGPFAYRWIDDVPVERIDLRSGERLPIEVIGSPMASATNGTEPREPSQAVVRAAMAAWN